MTEKYFTAWTIHAHGFAGAFQQALTDNQIGASWNVYRGPSGDAVVAENIAELDEEYADYIEDGIVEDYLNDED